MSSVATSSGVATTFKRRRSSSTSDENDGIVKRMRQPMYFYILAPESSADSSDSEESVYSIQAQSTDLAKDTSDTSSDSSAIEFDVVSFSDEPVYPFASKGDSSSSPEDVVRQEDDEHTVLVASDSSQAYDRLSAFSESGKDCSRTRMCSFSSCVLCGRKYPPTPYPYCIACYKVKKNFFPPRPKGRTKTLKNQQSKDSSIELIENPVEPERRVTADETLDVSDKTEMCGTCLVRPKDGGYVHKNVIHVYSCYNCSQRILKRTGKCPICNSRVNKVYKVITF